MTLLTNDIGKTFKCRLVPYGYKRTVGSFTANIQLFLGQIYNGDNSLGQKCFIVGYEASRMVYAMKNKVQFDGYCTLQDLSFTWDNNPLDVGPYPLLSLTFATEIGTELQEHKYVVNDLGNGYMSLTSKNYSDLPAWGNPKAIIVDTFNYTDGYELFTYPHSEIVEDSLAQEVTDIATYLTTNIIDPFTKIYCIASYTVEFNNTIYRYTEKHTSIGHIFNSHTGGLVYPVVTSPETITGTLGNTGCSNTLRTGSTRIQSTNDVDMDTYSLVYLFNTTSPSGSYHIPTVGTHIYTLNSAVNLTYVLDATGRMTSLSAALATPPANNTYSNLSMKYIVGRNIV